jgi:hypothetical protein
MAQPLMLAMVQLFLQGRDTLLQPLLPAFQHVQPITSFGKGTVRPLGALALLVESFQLKHHRPLFSTLLAGLHQPASITFQGFLRLLRLFLVCLARPFQGANTLTQQVCAPPGTQAGLGFGSPDQSLRLGAGNRIARMGSH